MTAYYWPCITRSQQRLSCMRSQLLLLLSACLGMDQSRLQLTKTMALVAIVPAAPLKVSPLVTSSLASNL